MEHIKELNNTVPEAPVLFLKPSSSLITSGSSVVLPKGCNEVHHEVELGVIMGRSCSRVTSDSAMDYVGGYCLALDMTARDFQNYAKKKGLPWMMAKAWDTSCPVSEKFDLPSSTVSNIQLRIDVNGVTKQDGNTKDMIHTIPSLIEYISTYFTLEEGDLILTGTPEGVGPVKDGDVMECFLTIDSTIKTKMKFPVALC